MGSGYKSFQPNTVLTASDVQGYLQDQAVMAFASPAARGSAIASPVEGMATYTSDFNRLHIYTGAAWESYTPGWVPVRPTSVDYTGGAAPTVGVMGEVVGDGKTSLSLNGVFSSTFRNYKINFWSFGTNAHEDCLRVRASSVDSTANYNYTRVVGNFNVLGRVTGSVTGEMRFSSVAAGAGTFATIEISRVNDPTSTQIITNASTYNADGQEMALTSNLHNVSSAYDGITFLPTAGSCNYIVQVFGYKGT